MAGSSRSCFFARYDPKHRACFGRTDPCHLLEKQWLKRAGVEDVWDRRLWVEGCRRHHGLFDHHMISVPHEALPWDFLAVCDELGLAALVDRRYGPLQRL